MQALGAAERRGPDGLEDTGQDEDDPRHDDSLTAVLSLSGYGTLVREPVGALPTMVSHAAGPGT
ncbi:hypothetical protein CCO02nite_02330 [Cellulomonas composti]|uniref:Uncharacterized protein n=1 Tax=Cellulomonas composti TaxID=266130 RepID=A0A511J6E8_9CELL|nr:hypothetical protein CCO02nite_02330 [Cellulomonas composti]